MLVLRIALLATVLVAAGCSTGAASHEPAASPGPHDLPASIVGPVVADIARISGLPADQVTVVSAESVTFPDAGLGCPVPGMAYAQVLVEGFKIVATAGGTTYDYRGTGPGAFRRCTNAGS